jgi:hypothetical protein
METGGSGTEPAAEESGPPGAHSLVDPRALPERGEVVVRRPAWDRI